VAHGDRGIPERAVLGAVVGLLRSDAMTATISTAFRICRQRLVGLWRDRSGIAATEFAIIVPLMLVLFFGVVEFSTGVAVDRKVTLVARTLSDLVSQNISVTDTQFTNFFNAGNQVMSQYGQSPYSASTLHSTISMLYVDPNTHTAKVQWSTGHAVRATGSVVTIPTALKVDGTYLIFSEVSYLYTPTVGYVMAPAGVNLADVSYTRPRQSSCVLYNTTLCPTN
jgi:Flp pilus assembly protein TadG